jgi:VWFA-related protein
MKHTIRLFVSCVLLAGLAWSQNSEDPPHVIRSGVSEVVVDVTVRHKNMSFDKRLRASDFSVTEDGRPQVVRGFRLVSGREARGASAGAGATSNAGSSGPPKNLLEHSLVSVVFGPMAPLSRQNAVEAANAFVGMTVGGDTYGAVFGLFGRGTAGPVVTAGSFTADSARLISAVSDAGRRSRPDLAPPPASILNQATFSPAVGAGGASVQGAASVGQSPDLATSGATEAPFSEGQSAVAAAADAQRSLISDLSGMAVIDALMRLIESESKLPGRKTILYLADGLAKPPNHREIFRDVILAANRGNISFYCVDVRGLSPRSSARGSARAPSSSSVLDDGKMAAFESMLSDVGFSNPKLDMAELAESTGGIAIFDTNEFEKNIARMVEDVRTHYELTYVSDNSVYDGHFRKVDVAVNRPELVVQSRLGYFALPDGNGAAVRAFEAEGLGALERPRDDFRFRVAALRFRPTVDGFGYQVVFDVDTAQLSPQLDPIRHVARVHGTFVALLKNASGEVIAKMSQEIDREVPENRAVQFLNGKVIVALPFEVAQGRYVLEGAVTSPESGKASTRRVSLIVPKPDGLSVSSLVLAREIHPPKGARDPSDSLQFAGGKVTPSLSEAPEGLSTVLFFVVYPERSAEKPRVTVSFAKDGTEVSRMQPQTGLVDQTNSIPMITAANLAPGEYVASVAVEQLGKVVRQSLVVNVPGNRTSR